MKKTLYQRYCPRLDCQKIETPYFFQIGQFRDAERLVTKYHYSHRMPSNIQVIGSMHQSGGLFGEMGPAIAACIFSIPPTRWSCPVIELSRLVRSDVEILLTGLISRTLKEVSRSGWHLAVSFADRTQGHHGGIYQAASWNYHGQRDKTMDGLIINGEFVPGRSCNSLYGTRSPQALKEMHPQWTIEPHYDEGKHLYWKPLSQKGKYYARTLLLESNPYPKTKGKEIHCPRCGTKGKGEDIK